MEKEYASYLNRCKKNKVAPTLTRENFLRIGSLKELVDAPFMKVGHGCVIKAILQGDLEIVDGEVVDHAGLLV
jgi:hypothetical protein